MGHRIGRTARAGRDGQSLSFLLPNEDAYSEFLRKRQIPLQDMSSAVATSLGMTDTFTPESYIEKTKELLRADRDIMMKANRAFVSHIAGYKEHQLSYLFNLRDLDIGQLATAYSLLRVPRMKEILGKKLDFENDETHPNDVQFADPVREKQRQQKLKKVAEEKANEEKADEEKANEKPTKEPTK